jgi:hypothetical protein
MTLTDFLLARIAEDQAMVHEADAEKPPFPLTWPTSGMPRDTEVLYALERAGFGDDFIGMVLVAADSARVLAECEAKRRIVENYQNSQQSDYPDYHGGYLSGLEDAMYSLVLPYADHADYQEDWRP